MKWVALLANLLLTACGLIDKDYTAYQQVIVATPSNHIGLFSDYPSLDVTETTIKYF